MNINKHIISQRINKIVQENSTWFVDTREEKKKISKAFVILAVSTYLNIELSETIDYITEGGGDASIDAIMIGDTNDLILPVTIFQGKYKHDLEVDSNFPSTEIKKIINTIKTIFDNEKSISAYNEEVKAKIEDIRSFISDGYIPNVRIVLFNNGIKWNDEGEQLIKNERFPKEQVEFEYINHDNIVDFIQSTKKIKASFKLTGKSFVEDFNYKRVLIGKVNVLEIKKIFDTYGDSLLEKNVRRYLGMNRNRVNEDISKSLLSSSNDNFYFKNNGITMVCEKIIYNALQEQNHDITADDLQVINGGQTCKTIQQTIDSNQSIDYSKVFILVRLYELSDINENNESLVNEITLATNSQNPVDLSDLRSNDNIQRKLETDIRELGYSYRRKKDLTGSNEVSIPLSVAAQAIYSIWKKRPHVAKFKRKELFGSLYNEVFSPTPNAAQVIIAVIVYRFCDNQRRKAKLIYEYPHLPYSNYFLAMIIGHLLLKWCKVEYGNLTHVNFSTVKEFFENNKDDLFTSSNEILIKSLNELYNKKYNELSLQILAAAFRRGDLLIQIFLRL